jgi:hypothetical protein
MPIALLGRVGREQFDAHSRQLFFGLGRVVVALSDDDPGGELEEFGEQVEFMSVGRSYGQASDDARPGYPHVYSKAVESLPEQRILAEGGLTAEAATPVGTSEQAGWQGHRVADGQGGIVGSKRKELLPELFLELPEVCRLPGEGGPMYLAEGRKPFSVVTAEEALDALVGVELQKLSDDLDGKDLRVGELWGGTALTDTPSFKLIVHQAEDGDDEGAKIHEGRPPLRRLVWSLPSVGRSSLSFKPSSKLAHGVS